MESETSRVSSPEADAALLSRLRRSAHTHAHGFPGAVSSTQGDSPAGASPPRRRHHLHHLHQHEEEEEDDAEAEAEALSSSARAASRKAAAGKLLSEHELQSIRLKINSRERKRMHDLNVAMDGLREVMPYAHGPSVRKLSKIATLLLARNYILMLSSSLDEMKRLLADVYGGGHVAAAAAGAHVTAGGGAHHQAQAPLAALHHPLLPPPPPPPPPPPSARAPPRTPQGTTARLPALGGRRRRHAVPVQHVRRAAPTPGGLQQMNAPPDPPTFPTDLFVYLYSSGRRSSDSRACTRSVFSFGERPLFIDECHATPREENKEPTKTPSC